MYEYLSILLNTPLLVISQCHSMSHEINSYLKMEVEHFVASYFCYSISTWVLQPFGPHEQSLLPRFLQESLRQKLPPTAKASSENISGNTKMLSGVSKTIKDVSRLRNPRRKRSNNCNGCKVKAWCAAVSNNPVYRGSGGQVAETAHLKPVNNAPFCAQSCWSVIHVPFFHSLAHAHPHNWRTKQKTLHISP